MVKNSLNSCLLAIFLIFISGFSFSKDSDTDSSISDSSESVMTVAPEADIGSIDPEAYLDPIEGGGSLPFI